MWDILTWNTVWAILRPLKLSPALSLALPIFVCLFHFSLADQRTGGKPPFISVTALFTSAGDYCSYCTLGCQTVQNATGPCALATTPDLDAPLAPPVYSGGIRTSPPASFSSPLGAFRPQLWPAQNLPTGHWRIGREDAQNPSMLGINLTGPTG